MNRGFLLVVALAGVAGGLYLYWRQNASALDYSADWPTALQSARAQVKPIILVFGGPW